MKKAVLFSLIIAVTVVNGAKIKPLRSRRSSGNKPLIRPKEAPVRTRNSGDTEDTENVENIESAKTINNMKINNKFLNERLKEIKAPKVKEVEKKRDNSKTYVGEYMKSTNMFVYKFSQEMSIEKGIGIFKLKLRQKFHQKNKLDIK